MPFLSAAARSLRKARRDSLAGAGAARERLPSLGAWILVVTACAGCSPGVFDKLATGSQPVEASDSGSPERDAGSDASSGSGMRIPGGASGGGAGRRASVGQAGRAAIGGEGGEPSEGQAGAEAGSGGEASNEPSGEEAGSGGEPGAAGAAGSEAGSGGSEAPPQCPHVEDPEQIDVAVTELGLLSVPSWYNQRFGGPSALVGDRMLWIFDTRDGKQVATWGAPSELLAMPPTFDGSSTVESMFPPGAVPESWAASPGSALAVDDDEALVFFSAGAFFLIQNAGLVRIAKDQPVATLVRPSGALFWRPPNPDGGAEVWVPPFSSAAFLGGSPEDESFIYLFGCGAKPDAPEEMAEGAHPQPCRLARLSRSNPSSLTNHRFWSGTAWTSDVTRAAIVVDHTPNSLSVSYNRYLGKLLMVYSAGDNMIGLRVADQPQGPWRMFGQLSTQASNAIFNTTIGARELPALRDECQQTIYLSYVRPYAEDPMVPENFTMETRLLKIKLQ
jgi:hypothetical protein